MVTVTIKRFANYWSMSVFILPSGMIIGFLAVKVENSKNSEILHTGGIPLKTLLGFQRVFNLTAASLGTEEEGTATMATKATAAPVVVVHFPITAYDLSVVDATGKRVTVVGAWTVGVGVEGSDETTVSATLTVA